MFIQEDLRNKNIAEYLLYMWQVEDVVRAAGLDSDRLYETVIKGSGRSESDMLKWKQWYDDLISMMYAEGKTGSGHLQVNENVLMLLDELHARLLESHKQQEYKDLYYRALPFIVEFRAKNHEQQNDELRDCFNLLYGVWMLKLQNKPVSGATAQAVKAISAFIGKLATLYNEDKAGQLDLD